MILTTYRTCVLQGHHEGGLKMRGPVSEACAISKKIFGIIRFEEDSTNFTGRVKGI